MNAVIKFASQSHFEVIDVTGGAPELVPHIEYLLLRLAPLTEKLVVRTNLVALKRVETSGLMQHYQNLKVDIVASLPSTNASQSDSQRGYGMWEKSIEVLKELNSLGFGLPETGLKLDLVVNPTGAYLPAGQLQMENLYKRKLQAKGVVFSNVLMFANAPLGRFKKWLEQSGNFQNYMETLFLRFNPEAVPGLMCRSLISVSWDGSIYDCDFNLAAGLFHTGSRVHITELKIPPQGSLIQTGEHCYACTAGTGFT
jgi:radical SAM/Cys-rich protein